MKSDATTSAAGEGSASQSSDPSRSTVVGPSSDPFHGFESETANPAVLFTTPGDDPWAEFESEANIAARAVVGIAGSAQDVSGIALLHPGQPSVRRGMRYRAGILVIAAAAITSVAITAWFVL